ncbi:MAG: cytochrome c [Gemmatimonadales bacterium]|jgi:mono/diheme cytochrome c family protein
MREICGGRLERPLALIGLLGLLACRWPSDLSAQVESTGEQLYGIGCASCHGQDGRGAEPDKVAFDVTLPDFSDCSFASREPDADWIAVAHQGGPVRGFDRTMPAFGEAFSEEQLQEIVDHVRSFCGDPKWPRGELNFPRALVTEKAFPEDELVYELGVRTEGPGAVGNAFVYERRLGSKSQIEAKLRFGFQDVMPRDPEAIPADSAATDWRAGLGDVELAFKHAFLHSLESGTIVSGALAVQLPTGTTSNGFGAGTTLFEPFLSFGQVLPAEAFLQGQGGFEISTNTEKASSEAFWRAAFGRSWMQGGWGRAWTPMVELLGSAELESGGTTQWSLVPQLQVTLSRRQHIIANIGVGLPLDDTEVRRPEILFYLLWEWFDGGFFAGW